MQGSRLEALTSKLGLSTTAVFIAVSVVVGLATGLAAIAFGVLINSANHVLFGLTDQILIRMAGPVRIHFWLPLIPALGGLLLAPIVYYFASEAKGHGVPEVMNAVARLDGIIRPRVAAAKAVASAICLGSGGSAGREGPIVQIGSAIGSTVAQMLRMSGQRTKLLVGCGAAAGISAVFNAPIAGVIFSLEIILGDFTVGTFAPVLIASVISSVVMRSVMGDHPAFSVPKYVLATAWEIPLYVVLAMILGLVSVLFVVVLDRLEDFFERLRLPTLLKPGLGGLLLGLLALLFPQVMADGYATIKLTLQGQIAVGLMFALIFMKIVATSLTLGSGGSGGVFAPSLFVGAAAGGAYGWMVHAIWPNVTAQPGAYALVGMAGVVAGATHAPMTALLIVFEMTGEYSIVLPLMIVVAISTLIARRAYGASLYTSKLLKRGIDIRAGRDVAVLRSLRVADVMDKGFRTVLSSTPLKEIFSLIENTSDTYFVVVNRDGKLCGILTLHDVRTLLTEHGAERLIIAQDLVRANTVVLHSEDNFEIALERFNLQDLRMLPVVDGADGKDVLGVVHREQLVDHYNKRLLDVMRG